MTDISCLMSTRETELGSEPWGSDVHAAPVLPTCVAHLTHTFLVRLSDSCIYEIQNNLSPGSSQADTCLWASTQQYLDKPGLYPLQDLNSPCPHLDTLTVPTPGWLIIHSYLRVSMAGYAGPQRKKCKKLLWAAEPLSLSRSQWGC